MASVCWGAGIILAIMIIPVITSITREVMTAVPQQTAGSCAGAGSN